MPFVSLQTLALVPYSLACVGCGFLVVGPSRLGRLGLRRESTWAVAFLLGLSALAVLWTALGLASALSATLIWFVVAPLAAFAFVVARKLSPTASVFGGVVETRSGWGIRIVGALTTFLAVCFMLSALFSPPDGDAVAFYLTYGKVIAASERLIPIPGSYRAFSSVGLITELHFAALMSIAGAAAAKAFPWLAGMAGALCLAQGVVSLGGGRTAVWLVLAMLLTSSAFTHHLWDGKVDSVAAALGMASLACALEVRGRQDKVLLGLAGVLAGFAAVAKFSYLVAVLPTVALLIVMRLYESNGTAATLAACTRYSIWAVAAWIPHFIKNAVFFGHPLVPFIAAAGIESWTEQAWFTPEQTRSVVAVYPLALVFGNYPMQIGNLSVLLLAFIPLLVREAMSRRLLSSEPFQVFLAASAGLVLWVVLRPAIMAPRYIFACLIFLALPAAWAAEKAILERGKHVLRGVTIAGLILALLLTVSTTRGLSHAMRFASGERMECLSGDNLLCETSLEVNQVAAEGTRVWFAGYFGYRLRADLLQCRDGAGEFADLTVLRGQELWEELYRRGFGMVVIDKALHPGEVEHMNVDLAPPWLKVGIVKDSADARILRIMPTNAPFPPRLECRQLKPPAWDVVPTRQAGHPH